jgi:hypothetical protein
MKRDLRLKDEGNSSYVTFVELTPQLETCVEGWEKKDSTSTRQPQFRLHLTP